MAEIDRLMQERSAQIDEKEILQLAEDNDTLNIKNKELESDMKQTAREMEAHSELNEKLTKENAYLKKKIEILQQQIA